MVKRARIKLTSTDTDKLSSVCDEIKDIAKKIGVKMVGPIPLPTKRMVVPVRRTPCGDGSNTWDKYEMRVHKRIIEVDARERVMRSIMRMSTQRSLHRDGDPINLKIF